MSDRARAEARGRDHGCRTGGEFWESARDEGSCRFLVSDRIL